MNFWALLRMARWVRHPPRPQVVRIWIAVLLAIAALLAVEHFVGWPDWATVNMPGRRLPR